MQIPTFGMVGIKSVAVHKVLIAVFFFFFFFSFLIILPSSPDCGTVLKLLTSLLLSFLFILFFFLIFFIYKIKWKSGG